MDANRGVALRSREGLGGRDVELIQAPELVSDKWSDYKDQQVDTTELVIRNLSAGEVEAARELSQGLSTEEHFEAYATCQDLIREYLLRLLGYEGPVFPFSSPNVPVRYPGGLIPSNGGT